LSAALRLGTRGSALALAQARWVAARMGAGVELVEITTAGDLRRDVGDKSRWTGTLESALVAGEIDLAVHSAKDVPGELAAGTGLVAVPPRADARDVLVGATSLEVLPRGARVGTASLRRRSLVLAARPDLEVVELRGNVDTRLRKLGAGGVDALVLAAAGLERLGLLDAIPWAPLGPDVFVPAPGQGALAVQARTGDDAVAAAVGAATGLADAAAFAVLAAERDACRVLGASCHTPVGVWAAPVPGGGAGLRVHTFAGLPDGSEWILDAVEVDAVGDAGRIAGERLLAAGAADLLARATAAAA
jgi:hydroxymethylbilane synthase